MGPHREPRISGLKPLLQGDYSALRQAFLKEISSLLCAASNLAYGASCSRSLASSSARVRRLSAVLQVAGCTEATIGAKASEPHWTERDPRSRASFLATAAADSRRVFPSAAPSTSVASIELVSIQRSSNSSDARAPGKVRCMSQLASLRSVLMSLRYFRLRRMRASSRSASLRMAGRTGR